MEIKRNQINNLAEHKNILLIPILVTFVIFALLYSLTTPSLEAPDEGSHYSAILYMYDNDLNPGRVGRLLEKEPIYHGLTAVVYSLFPEKNHYVTNYFINPDYPHTPFAYIHNQSDEFPFSGDPAIVHTLRLLSIIYGVISLIFIYKIGIFVFQNSKWLPLIMTASVATLPTFVWMNSVINPDPLLWMFSTISIYFLLKFSSTNYRYIALVSVFAFLAMSTKSQGMLLYPIIFTAFGYFLFSKKLDWKIVAKSGAIFIAVTILSLAIFSSYNALTESYELEESQKLGGIQRLEIFTKGNPSIQYVTDPNHIHTRLLKQSISGMGWNTIWSFYDMPTDIFFSLSLGESFDKTLASSVYHIIDILIILCVIGFILYIKNRNRVDVTIDNRHMFIIVSSIIITILAIFSTWIFSQAGLARYTFAIISCYGIFFTLGWSSIVKNKRLKIMIFVPILFFVVMNVQNLIVIDERSSHGMQDFTGDGIMDNVDSNPGIFSNDFRMVHEGNEITGVILNRELESEDTDLILNQSEKSANLFFLVTKNNDGIQIMNAPYPESRNLLVSMCNDNTKKEIPPKSGIIFSCKNQSLDKIKNIDFIPILPKDIENGDLIQGKNRSQLYFIENGVKRHVLPVPIVDVDYVFGNAFPIKRTLIPSFSLEDIGFSHGMIKFVPDNMIDKIPKGKKILSATEFVNRNH